MMRFFRKYTKHLLVVFMSLLLLVWLAPSAMFRGSGGGPNADIGEAFGATITYADLGPVRNEVELVQQLMMPWSEPWRYTLLQLGMGRSVAPQQVREAELTIEEWYLLLREARERQVYVSAASVEVFKERWGLGPEAFKAVRNRLRVSGEYMDQALRSFLVVGEAALLACEAVQVSEADVQDYVRRTQEQAEIEVVSIPASAYRDEEASFTDDELTAHFEAYKNAESQPAGRLEFGYQLPEAVQVEYIRVDAGALAERQETTEQEAYAYWETHRSEFLKPATKPAPSTRPAPPPPREPYDTFTEAKAEVLERLAEERGNQEAMRVARDLIDRLQRPWANAPVTQPGDYRTPPDSETSDQAYPKLLDGLQDALPGVLTYERTPLLDAQGLTREEGIGRARALAGTQQQTWFAQAAMLVAGLEADRKGEANLARYFRNVHETCAEPFIDSQGNVYVFRTVAARPKQAVAEIDDALRERLTQDLRGLRAHEQAEKAARELAERAKSAGLDAALAADPALKEKLGAPGLMSPKPFARYRSFSYQGMPPMLTENALSEFPGDRDLVKLAFSLAGQTTTQPAPIAVHEERDRQRWLVLELQRVIPPTTAEYEAQRPSAVVYAKNQAQLVALRSWFDGAQIKARTGWKPAEPKDAKDKPAEGESEDEGAT